jgi:N-acetylgalactosamine-N,N'-diacetylbacillosaminyl-diphospho-undecaprenol 4-alpha-N-acetylgalactosaminyltransferase
MRKKIVIFAYSLDGGGAERTVANLLNSMDRQKYDIHLVLMNTHIAYKIPGDQVIHYLEKSNQYELNAWKLVKLPFLASRLSKYCKQNEIELVFALMNRPNMIATMAKWFGLKAKVLISEQFYTPYLYNKASLAGRFKTWLLKKCYTKADCILPNSQGTIEALKNEFQVQSDYELIKNPTNIQAIKKLRFEPVDELINFGKFTFLNVSAFRPEKNHDLLIDAVAELRDRDFQLLLVGKGILLNQMKEKVAQLGLEDKIIFIPFVDNPFKYLYRSGCFLLSSFGEGFPNILIESMICELPIISVDCKTGPRELLAPGTSLHTVIPPDSFEIAQYGLLCAFNSKTSLVAAMNWALDHPEKLKEFKSAAAAKAAEFDMKEVAHELSFLIDRYLHTPRIPATGNAVLQVPENSPVS